MSAQTLEGIYEEFKNENYDEVINLVQDIPPEKRTPELSEIYARSLLNIGDIEGAERVIRSLLSQEPGRESAKLLLAEILTSRGMYTEALGLLKEVKEGDEKNYLLGLIYFNSGRFSTARSYFGKVSPDYSRYGEALLYSAVSYINENRQNKVISLIGELKDSPYTELLKDYLENSSRFRFSLRLGFEYDSNVNISPETLPKRSSTRTYGLFSVSRSSERLAFDMSAYAGFNRRVPSYDISELNGNLKLRGERLFLPVGFSYTLVGRDFYSTDLSGGIGFDGEIVEVSLEGGYMNFREPVISEEDRDGAFARIRLKSNLFDRGFLSFLGSYYPTLGDNWKRYELEISGSYAEIIGRLGLGLTYKAVYAPYLKNNSVFVKKRRDTFLALLPYVSFRVLTNGYIVGNFSLYRNISNIDIYDYTRYILGVSFYYGF